MLINAGQNRSPMHQTFREFSSTIQEQHWPGPGNPRDLVPVVAQPMGDHNTISSSFDHPHLADFL
jgi:hypothetical protein